MSLSTCSSCDAFVPVRATTCPSCGASQGLAKRAAKLAALAAMSSSFVTTLMACYGVAMPYPGTDSGVNDGAPARATALLTCDVNGDGDCDDPGETPPK